MEKADIAEQDAGAVPDSPTFSAEGDAEEHVTPPRDHGDGSAADASVAADTGSTGDPLPVGPGPE